MATTGRLYRNSVVTATVKTKESARGNTQSPPTRDTYRRAARNSSGGCGDVRAKTNVAANSKQDGNANGVCFGGFPRGAKLNGKRPSVATRRILLNYNAPYNIFLVKHYRENTAVDRIILYCYYITQHDNIVLKCTCARVFRLCGGLGWGGGEG